MSDLIERSLLTALTNMIGPRPYGGTRQWVVYDSDIPKLVKDIRAGLAGENPREVGPEPAPQTFAEFCANKSSVEDYLKTGKPNIAFNALIKNRAAPEVVAEDYHPGCA
jgi:hypothetical protein